MGFMETEQHIHHCMFLSRLAEWQGSYSFSDNFVKGMILGLYIYDNCPELLKEGPRWLIEAYDGAHEGEEDDDNL